MEAKTQSREVIYSRPPGKGVAEARCKPTSYPNLPTGNHQTPGPQETGSGERPSPDTRTLRRGDRVRVSSPAESTDHPAASQVRGLPTCAEVLLSSPQPAVPCPHCPLPGGEPEDSAGWREDLGELLVPALAANLGCGMKSTPKLS